MLTSLEPPSPASSAVPREVEFMPSRSLQTTPQLPGGLPMTSPPRSYPEKHRDTAESSRVPPVFKWLQTRFKQTKKNWALQPPDQLSTGSGPPLNLSNSQGQATANIVQNGPARFAAGQRVRVSVFFFGRQRCVVCLMKYVCQRAVAVNLVRRSVCSLACCLSCVTG